MKLNFMDLFNQLFSTRRNDCHKVTPFFVFLTEKTRLEKSGRHVAILNLGWGRCRVVKIQDAPLNLNFTRTTNYFLVYFAWDLPKKMIHFFNHKFKLYYVVYLYFINLLTLVGVHWLDLYCLCPTSLLSNEWSWKTLRK